MDGIKTYTTPLFYLPVGFPAGVAVEGSYHLPIVDVVPQPKFATNVSRANLHVADSIILQQLSLTLAVLALQCI